MWLEVSEPQSLIVTTSQYQPDCCAVHVCPVAPEIAAPSKYHWLPVGALLVSTSPRALITGDGGTALTVTAKIGETVPLPQELVPRTVMSVSYTHLTLPT